MNYGIDSGLYPLGSCTMKYNPRLNERLARLIPGRAELEHLLLVAVTEANTEAHIDALAEALREVL